LSGYRINDSGGARIQEGVTSLAGYAEIFERNILASGVIPQISAIFGPCAGGAVYSPALTDFVMMTEQNSYMFVTGPKVVKSVTGEDISTEDLGGADVHAGKSGVSHFKVENEEEGMMLIRKLLSYLPQNNLEEAPLFDTKDPIDRLEDALNSIVPDNPNHPYDMKDVIHAIVDNGEFLEIHRHYARNIIVGFARFNGVSTGIVANQPNFLAGVLDCDASRKAADLFVSAMHLIFRCLPWLMFPDFYRVQVRNTPVSSFMEQNSCLLMARLQFRKLQLHSVNRTVALTM
jgi:acetyl-CoA carboxylase carboxyltransferase component